MLDPCTHARQKPLAERAANFRALPFGNDPAPYEPDRTRLSDRQLLLLAVEPLDAQRGRGSTLMLSTFHLAGPCGTRGRDVELLLARLAVEHFRRERMEEPPQFAAVNARREIYATIAVKIEDLRSAHARRALAEAYLELGADGVWVKIADFHERATLGDIRAASSFLGMLREGEIPVVSCGPGQLHLALLSDEISASIGLAESERFITPANWKPRNAAGKRRGRSRMAYHAKLHWSFRVGSNRPSVRSLPRLAHAACIPPANRRPACWSHATRQILRSDQASEALTGEPAERREWLLGDHPPRLDARAARASPNAQRAKVLGLGGRQRQPGWYNRQRVERHKPPLTEIPGGQRRLQQNTAEHIVINTAAGGRTR